MIKKIDCVKINKNFSYYSKKKVRFIMKANFNIGIIAALLLTGSTLKAQVADMRDFRNDDARIVNNYYDDYDYYFSSRINRFHRSYSAFDYYSPVFTETYWYNYQPHSWGISIYGGGGFGIGYSYNYPVYNYGYGNFYGGYEPYFGSSYYWGYDCKDQEQMAQRLLWLERA
jgi:hypothetical protein